MKPKVVSVVNELSLLKKFFFFMINPAKVGGRKKKVGKTGNYNNKLNNMGVRKVRSLPRSSKVPGLLLSLGYHLGRVSNVSCL